MRNAMLLAAVVMAGCGRAETGPKADPTADRFSPGDRVLFVSADSDTITTKVAGNAGKYVDVHTGSEGVVERDGTPEFRNDEVKYSNFRERYVTVVISDGPEKGRIVNVARDGLRPAPK